MIDGLQYCTMYSLMEKKELTNRLGHAALESDRYGHPKKNCPTRLNVQVRCNWIRVPQADRFGHFTNPSAAIAAGRGAQRWQQIRLQQATTSSREL
jgi:hypothetical protein